MAYRPDPEQPTPYEELGGGIREPWREDDTDTLFTLEVPPVSHTTSPPEKKRRRYSRRGGRAYNEPDNELDITSTYVERTPEERAALHQDISELRATVAHDTALMDPMIPAEQFDDMRRRALRWAAAEVASANMADGAAKILSDPLDERREQMRRFRDAEHASQLADDRRFSAEQLVLSACKKCIFIDRCELAGAEQYVVQQLADKAVRESFVTAMSGQYGSSYVSCESVIKS